MSDTQQPGPSDDEAQDEALKETFPASDPPAVGGVTGPDDKSRADTLEERP